jgi:hypothetical protein
VESVKDGKIKIKSSDFPAFIYPSNRRFHPFDRAQGLLRGDALVRVSDGHPIYISNTDNDLGKTFRLLFTGANSAATGVSPKGSKKCKAAIHGIRDPTPETIAYSAILVSSSFIIRSTPLIILTPDALQCLICRVLVYCRRHIPA